MDDVFGKLYIQVVEARNTLALDVTGTSDPYVVVQFQPNPPPEEDPTGARKKGRGKSPTPHNEVEEVKTGIVWKTLNPKWEREEFVFDVSSEKSRVTLDMWDKDEHTSDDFMGRVVLMIDHNTATSLTDDWYPMTGRRGAKKKKMRLSKKKERGDLRLKVQYVRYTKLLSAITEPSLDLVSTLSTWVCKDDLAQALVTVFQESDKVSPVDLCASVIHAEVSTAERTTTLFRTDSMATKIMNSFSRLCGLLWLHEALRPLVLEVVNHPGSVEVNPAKLPEGEDLGTNKTNLINSLERFLEVILASEERCPRAMRMVCARLYDEVSKKFPGTETQAVGGFIFLRFFCPAVLSPEVYAVVEESPSVEARRHLVLVAKALQNIANKVLYGKKEAFMEFLNPILESYVDRVTAFFSRLSVDCDSASDMTLALPHDLTISHLDVVVQYICDNMEKLSEEMTNKEALSLAASESNLKFLPLIGIRRKQLQSLEAERKHHHGSLFRIFHLDKPSERRTTPGRGGSSTPGRGGSTTGLRGSTAGS